MVPPVVRVRQGVISTRKGQDITLSCAGKGHPNPRITWSKKVRKLLEGNMDGPFVRHELHPVTATIGIFPLAHCKSIHFGHMC